MMFRMCGAPAYAVAFIALLATLVSALSVALSASRARGSLAIAAGALGLGVLTLLAGTAGTFYGRNAVDGALGGANTSDGPLIDPAVLGRLRVEGYSEAFQCTRLGAMASVLPLCLGLAALVIALRKPTVLDAGRPT